VVLVDGMRRKDSSHDKIGLDMIYPALPSVILLRFKENSIDHELKDIRRENSIAVER
jgi:hypothetical protein